MTREQLAELADLAHAENDATHALSEIRVLSVDAYLSALEGSAYCHHCTHLYADVTRWLARGARYVPAWLQQEDVFYCPSCWTTCSDCGDRVGRDVWVRLRDGRRVCEGCLENYTFCANCGDECDAETDRNGNGSCCRPEDDEDSGDIGEYHSHAFRSIPGVWSKAHNRRYFGVELEVECRDYSRVESAETVAHAHNDIVLEGDGSLNYGYEIITQPCGMDRQREIWTAVLQASPSRVATLRSHNTDTCGLHVHVSRQGVSSFTLAKAVVFVNDPANESLIRAVARRYGSNHYARAKEKKLSGAHVDDGDRYQYVNLCREATIEFRIFRGSLNYRAVIAAIQFSHAVLSFAANASAGALTTAAFLAYIDRPEMRADTDELRAYLVTRPPYLMRPAPLECADTGRKRHHASNHIGRYTDCPHCAKDASAHAAVGAVLHINEQEN